METLWMYLQSCRNQTDKLAISFTLIHYTVGLLVRNDIYKKGRTYRYSVTPFIIGITVAALCLKYSWLIEDGISITICAISLVIHAVYIMFYAVYSQDKWRNVGEPLLYATTVTCLLYTYTQIEKEEKVLFRYGLVIKIILLILMASPLRNLRLILTNQDSSYIPCVSATISFVITILLIAYSVAVSDRFLLAQNLCRGIITSVQVILCLKYPRRNREVTFPSENNENLTPEPQTTPIKKIK